MRFPWLIPDHDAVRSARDRESGSAASDRRVDGLAVFCVLLVRTFSAEAYVVPTGSMAPTLLGLHREIDCPNCQFLFVVGIDEDGTYAARPVCPNCGQGGLDKVRLDRMRRRPCAGRRISVRISEAQALGSGRLPFSGRADPGLCQARSGTAWRIDPDR